MSGSTWGACWGDTWGDTWGADDTTPIFVGGVRHRPSDTRRQRLIDDDELILIMFAKTIAGFLH